MNIFTNPYNQVETWSAQGAVVTYTNNGTLAGLQSPAVPLIMQNIQMSYTQKTTEFYAINTNTGSGANKVILKGSATGTMSVGSVYGPTMTGLQAFIEAVSKDTSEQVSIFIHPFGSTCNKQATGLADIILKNVELVQVGFNLQGGEAALVTMPLVFSFTGMELNPSSNTNGTGKNKNSAGVNYNPYNSAARTVA